VARTSTSKSNGKTPASKLLAGAATGDITPAMGIVLAGDIGHHRTVEEIRERLYAHALVLQVGKKRFCFVSMDLCIFSNGWSDHMRSEVQKRFGIPAEAVALGMTQNHAAPSMGNLFCRDSCKLMPPAYPWLRGGDERYNLPAVETILETIGRAAASVQPVELRAGRVMDGRVAFNRRFVMRDGTAVCHPPICSPDILRAEGPTDPEVGVWTLGTGSGTPLAVVLHHTCHPCHGYPHRYVIADWPGTWATQVQERHGQSLTPVVVNGCCGNIHHTNHIDPGMPDAPSKQDHRQMGRMLADSSDRAMANLELLDTRQLDWRRTYLKLPMRKVPPKVLADAKKLIKANPEPMWLNEEHTRVNWEWVYAISQIDLHEWQQETPVFDYEIQAVRIGDAALVTVMGEPFVEGQLDIKLRSPAKYTMVAHMCNGYAGYIPTPEALKRGGYETKTANWSKFEPDALQKIADKSVQLLKQMF
jgi:hypothetical protein